ncbi:hypothetical protein CK203_083608 [Vitis vinifera]|uniref:Uncharacterized protein n=1 Tax=Vitis vinifera TaxID=29760 RepID=A0A438BS83_VITVI|nr:hypothetical protein CK203_083608 [Vitis vinifera]
MHILSLQIMNKLLETAAKNKYRDKIEAFDTSSFHVPNSNCSKEWYYRNVRENPASVSHGTIYDTDREDGRNIVLLGVEDVIVSLNEHIKRPEEIYMEAKNGLLFHCSSNRNERAVPSGVNQHTCEPIFQHHLAFKFFAIALLFVLCSSFISLLIIFALLTSKYQYKDFVTYFALQQLPSYVVLVKATFQNVPERLYNEDPL